MPTAPGSAASRAPRPERAAALLDSQWRPDRLPARRGLQSAEVTRACKRTLTAAVRGRYSPAGPGALGTPRPLGARATRARETMLFGVRRVAPTWRSQPTTPLQSSMVLSTLAPWMTGPAGTRPPQARPPGPGDGRAPPREPALARALAALVCGESTVEPEHRADLVLCSRLGEASCCPTRLRGRLGAADCLERTHGRAVTRRHLLDRGLISDRRGRGLVAGLACPLGLVRGVRFSAADEINRRMMRTVNQPHRASSAATNQGEREAETGPFQGKRRDRPNGQPKPGQSDDNLSDISGG
jgi:hypothetical protein